MKKTALLFWVLFFSSPCLWAFTTHHRVVIRAVNHSLAVRVAVADRDETRALGLMGVKDLEDDQGMLFVYPEASYNKFWMKNTPTSLDILFISNEHKIVFIAKSTTPFSEEVIDPKVKSQFVLEVKSGFVDRHHVAMGDFVDF